MKHHPEQQDGEIYMGNNTAEDIKSSVWRTYRLGEVARDANGNPFEDTRFKPSFIEAAEVKSAIETARQSNKPGSAETARVLQEMVDRGTSLDR